MSRTSDAAVAVSGGHHVQRRTIGPAPDLEPGQIWLVAYPPSGGLSALDRQALAGADVVLYDRVLAPVIADLLRPGSYAEPLPAEGEECVPAISPRALKLAFEGWGVVQLVRLHRAWRRRLCGAAEELGRSSGAKKMPLRLIANTAQPPGRREVPLGELSPLLDRSAEDEPLTLIIGPLAEGVSAAGYAFIGNGLAG